MRIHPTVALVLTLCAGVTATGQTTANPVLREGPVAIDQAVLVGVGVGDRLELGLFEGLTVAATIDRVTPLPDGRSLFGHLDDGGTVVMTLGGGMTAGFIQSPKGTFQIRPNEAGVGIVEEIDPAGFPGCATTHEHAVAGAGPGGAPDGGIAGNCDDGTLIDVLVVYTPLARAAAGGNAQIELIAQQAVAVSNNAYNNSNINMQLRLVHSEEVNYNENGSYGQHLERLAGTVDGIMDNVHDLRDIYGADMVACLVVDGQYCGIAYLMQNNSPSFQGSAFSITTWTCAVGNLTFAHELGHNMGCAHDPANAGGGGLYSYSYGYQHPNNLFRTVMAYNCSGGCPRVSHLSNPDATYGSWPTGTSTHNNAQTISLSAPTISNFRCSDCNGNGVADLDDVIMGNSPDCDSNSIPDECDLDSGAPDCNGNGLIDTCDIGGGGSTDYDASGVPDECECLANLTIDDDTVDTTDFLIVLSQWGSCQECISDINRDSTVDTLDLLYLLGHWGPCP